jgi:hypothetical protein
MASTAAISGETENPLRLAHWLGQVDPRPLAIFRIGCGCILLHDLFDYSRDFRAFLTDDGIVPRSILSDPAAWSIFRVAGEPWAVAALFAITVAAELAFTLGLFTRLATVASWVMLTSLHNRNPYILDGGDVLARILLFFAMFSDLGACWSLDTLWRGRPAGPARAIGPRLMRYHLAALYGVTAWQKFHHGNLHGDWIQGETIYKALQLKGFVRPLGALLGTHPAICAALTRTVIFLEAAFPLLALSPFAVKRARAGAMVANALVQLGILMTLRVGIFTELTLWTGMLYLQPEWLDALERWMKRGREAPLSSAAWANRTLAPASAAQMVLAALLVLQLASADLGWVTHLRQPRFALIWRHWLGIDQPWDLFGEISSVIEWEAPGRREDGTPVDVLAVAEPGLVAQVRVRFSRWYIFEEPDRHTHFETLGPYLCRAFDEADHGPRLQSFTLVRHSHPPRASQGPEPPVTSETLWVQECPHP